MDVNEARAFLRKCREENGRQSSKVVELYREVLSDSMKSLGDEKWIVYEQVALASFDTRDWAISKECIEQLSQKFPGSHRVRKLKAMQLETLGAYRDAEKIYDALLAEDEANSSVHKRKIAILKAQDLIPEAIKKLCEYLKKFQSDQEAWLELSNLYIEENDFPKAAFCMEELLLTSPHNHLYHQRYAELQYLVGTVESVELARAYFAQALKFNPRNKEALFGFCSAAQWLAASSKLSSQKKKDNQKYLTWAIDQIRNLYQKEIGALEEEDAAVEDLMAKLSLTSASGNVTESSEKEKKAI